MSEPHCIATEPIYAEHPFALEILTRLQEAGHDAVLIGGVVRDGLQVSMGRRVAYPPQDIDIATSALPDEIRALFSDRTILSVGEAFGVLLIIGPNERPYEVATFRVESEYDGRWPATVRLVRDLASDVRRRDLTINGLAASADGAVIDLVNGIQDLRDRRVATIGDPNTRFGEDYLRMMRAVRFACRIDGDIDPMTARAIRDHASSIIEISAERIGEELLRILGTPHASRGVMLLDDLGLLEVILPELVECQGVPQPEEYHPEGDVYVHTMEALKVADGYIYDPIVKLAVMLHDIGKPIALERNEGVNMGGHCAIGARMAKTVGRRLRLSNQQADRLAHLVRQHMRIADFPAMGRGKQVRFLSEGERPEQRRYRDRYPLFFQLLQLMVADCEASAHRSTGWAPILREAIRVADHVDHVCGLQKARSLLDGHDLAELGLAPGPRTGQILDRVHDRILAGFIVTREDALDLARTLIAQTPLAEDETIGR